MCLCKAGGLAYVKGKIASMYQPPRYSYDLHSIPFLHVQLHSAAAFLPHPPSRKLTPCAASSIPQDVPLLLPSLSGLVPVRPAAPPVAPPHALYPPLFISRVRPLFTHLRRGTGSLRIAILIVHPLGRFRSPTTFLNFGGEGEFSGCDRISMCSPATFYHNQSNAVPGGTCVIQGQVKAYLLGGHFWVTACVSITSLRTVHRLYSWIGIKV